MRSPCVAVIRHSQRSPTSGRMATLEEEGGEEKVPADSWKVRPQPVKRGDSKLVLRPREGEREEIHIRSRNQGFTKQKILEIARINNLKVRLQLYAQNPKRGFVVGHLGNEGVLRPEHHESTEGSQYNSV